jgi:hypothetical protein
MRTRYLADENGHWIPERDWRAPKTEGVIVMPDIEPYQSMITGEVIQSRSRHREHLREHGCIEIGNETNANYYNTIPDVAPEQRRELIRAQIDAMSHEQFRQALKRDADRVKWQSRED